MFPLSADGRQGLLLKKCYPEFCRGENMLLAVSEKMLMTQGFIVMAENVCPWWLAYTFDNPLRRFVHKPEMMFDAYLHSGMTAIDIGCGLGYFSIGMAEIVGQKGKIISVDVQQKMLDILATRVRKKGLDKCIHPFLCRAGNIGIDEKVDFALAFWVAHETPDQLKFIKQIHSILNRSGKLFLAEPKMHVTLKKFNKTLSLAETLSFNKISSPEICFSHAAVLEKH